MSRRADTPKGTRPYSIDYGTSKGHCKSPQNAKLRAIERMQNEGRKHLVIEQPHGPPVDVWLSGAWGLTVQVRRGAHKVVPIEAARAARAGGSKR